MFVVWGVGEQLCVHQICIATNHKLKNPWVEKTQGFPLSRECCPFKDKLWLPVMLMDLWLPRKYHVFAYRLPQGNHDLLAASRE